MRAQIGLAPRNLDVFATELLPAARAGLPDEPGWDDLGATLDRLRRAADERSAETILSERFTTVMLHLLRWFEARGWRDYTPSENTALPTSPIGEVAPRVAGVGLGLVGAIKRAAPSVLAPKGMPLKV